MQLSNREWWSHHGYSIDKIQPILDLVDKRRREIANAIDTHHYIPRGAKGHIVGADHKRNRGEIQRGLHVARHLIFGEELPHEQDQSNFDFNERVYGREAKDLQKEYRGEVARLLGKERLYVGVCWEERNGIVIPKGAVNRFSMKPKTHRYSSYD